LTAVMLVVVNSVSALVHLYSIGYMSHDEHRARFFAYLSLFTFAMLMLVTADNLLQMFFGWEGVGVASYLLIGFWYKKASANSAAMKAFIVNRVGDFGFLLGIFGVFVLFGSIRVRCDHFRNRRRGRQPGDVQLPRDALEVHALTTICCCCSWARWASRRSSCCTPGCRTRWKARHRSRRSFTRPPW
jgi:NADH:ubiquinone oxidoreductase subunit 5 (subunit L)/multisubunit Na+/H+ antiporter MnhA subunit